MSRVSQKVKELLKQIYYKYSETKLILLSNVIFVDFKAPIPAFHKFLNSERKRYFLVKFNTLSLKFTPNFILLDYYIKKDETGSTRSTHWKQEMHITF
jgi:hypothetical protein